MRNALSFACGVLCGTLALFFASTARAQSIDLSLNVLYLDPQDTDSGGIWTVTGKSSHSGIASLSLRLAGIDSSVTFHAPLGTVNGSDRAGFGITSNLPQTGHRNVILHQIPIPPTDLQPGDEQSVFYGVGTLEDGAPNWPGKPPGTNSIGPAFTSLTNVSNVPWAPGDVFGDLLWDRAALFASGTFAEGITPSFFSGTTGQVFSSVGGSTTAGAIDIATITAIVRTNSSSQGLAGDFNQDGSVDAADYLIWRKNNDTSNPLPNDGGLGTPVSVAHYNLWRENFGMTAGSGAGGHLSPISAVPEPFTGALVAIGIALTAAWRARRPASICASTGCARRMPTAPKSFAVRRDFFARTR